MARKDKRIDEYIRKAPAFAQPILKHLRALVHAGCPAAEETLKWNSPAFMHKGILCLMAAFKEHCTFGFWKGKLIFTEEQKNKKGVFVQFGRITALADLPGEKELMVYIRKAVELNETGITAPRPQKKRKTLVIPGYFTAALRKNKKALTAFEQFSYSHKKEYVEWIVDAKREETRQRRLATALTWLADGKPRHWKYARC